MYTTAINPWQTSGFIPQQQYFTAQSFLPLQPFQQSQAYSLPMQTGTGSISPWGYNLPVSNVMFSPPTSMQAGFVPQYNWQATISPLVSGQFAQISPPMQQQVFQQMHQQMHQQMQQQGLTTGIRSAAGFAQPRVELAETNNDVIVTADLPNVDPNNIYVTVTDDSLSISALAHMGGISSSLHRTVALPTNVRSEHLDISYTNGTLECRLPKSDFAARRRVKVNATG